MSADLSTFAALLDVRTHEEIFSFLARYCDQLGFTSYFYAPLVGGQGAERFIKDEKQVVESEHLVRHNIFTNYPAAWVRRYQEAGHVAVDPLLQRIGTSNVPLYWSDLGRVGKTHIVMDEARQHGLADGLAVTVSGMDGSRALLCLATDVPLAPAPAQRAATMGQALLTVLHVHEALQRLGEHLAVPIMPQLTPREKECLVWAAQGKTSWEIARILALSERGITFHMVNATRKLKAANRRQAIVRAISLKLIEP